MLAFILFIIIICILLGVFGFVVKGLFYLFVIGVILFIIAVLTSFFRMGSRHGRRHEAKNRPRPDE